MNLYSVSTYVISLFLHDTMIAWGDTIVFLWVNSFITILVTLDPAMCLSIFFLVIFIFSMSFDLYNIVSANMIRWHSNTERAKNISFHRQEEQIPILNSHALRHPFQHLRILPFLLSFYGVTSNGCQGISSISRWQQFLIVLRNQSCSISANLGRFSMTVYPNNQPMIIASILVTITMLMIIKAPSSKIKRSSHI
jgi:hypothetical protein